MRPTHRERRTPSATRAQPTEFDTVRLRAALRLIFGGRQADRIATLATPGDLVTRVTFAYVVQRALGALAAALPRPRDQQAPPLAPRRGLDARAALALALHLGLDLDGDRLAALFEIPPAEVGNALARARAALRPDLPRPCDDLALALGRVRDPALDLNTRATLMEHVPRCDACRATLAGYEALDAELVTALARIANALPPPPAPASRLRRVVTSPVGLLVAGALVVVAAILLAGTVQDRLAARNHVPVPLRLEAPPAGPSGWLILASDTDGVEALNPATSERRSIVPSPGSSGRYQPSLISPDRTRIATWTSRSAGADDAPGGTLVVRRIDGSVVQTWRPPPGEPLNFPLAWLDDTTMIFAQIPSHQDSRSHLPTLILNEHQTRLLAVDLGTSSIRPLYSGSVSNIAPSPDGTLVAVVHGFVPNRPGGTVDLRPVGPDGLEPPVATLEQRYSYGSGLVWAPDSSRVYLGMLGDGDGRHVALGALGRDGSVTTIVATGGSEALRPMAVSPGGDQIMYQRRTRSEDPGTWTIWVAGQDGRRPERVLQSLPSPGAGAVWLGDDSALILALRPFYLTSRTTSYVSDATPWPVLLQATPGTHPQPIMSLPEAVGSRVIGWVPDDAITDKPVPVPRIGHLTAPAPVPHLPRGYRTDAQSGAGATGDLALLTSTTLTEFIAWEPSADGPWSLAPGMREPSWLPGGRGMIAVVDRPSGSRLTLVATRAKGIGGQDIDPAGLGDDPLRSYARPVMSPSGNAVAFWVIDQRRHSAGLWVASWHDAPRQVLDFPTGDDLLDPPPMVATWANADTLLVATPAAFQDGLPREVRVLRVDLGSGSTTSVNSVLTLSVRGGDVGLVMTDLALSPGGRHLAYRLRHYTRRDAQAGVYESVAVAPVEDVARPVELARGAPSQTLAWSPDGGWLAFDVRGQVGVASADGRTLAFAETQGRASAPIWFGADEVWFTLDAGADAQVMRITVR